MDHSDHTLLQAGSQTAISDRMRELLARAAQDHVYEQRSQDAVLDEIRRRLEGMEWLLREVRERELGGLSGTLESVNGRLDDISARPPEWAEGLAQHVEAVRDRVDAVGERVGAVGRGVESVRDRVVPLGELPSLWADVGAVGENVEEVLVLLRSIADGAKGTDDLVGDVAGRLGRVQAGMEAAAGRFTRLDRAMGELTQRAGRLETGMRELAADVKETVGGAVERLFAVVEQVNAKAGLTAARLDALDERLDDIEGRVTGRIEAVDSRLRALDGSAERLASLETRAAEGGERLGGLEGHVTGVGERLGSLEAHLADVGERLGRLAATLDIGGVHRSIGTLLGAQADDHAKRFDSLEECVAQARSALVPLAETLRAQPNREQLAEALTRTMEPARADLTRRLGALEETMLALAEALLRPVRNDKD